MEYIGPIEKDCKLKDVTEIVVVGYGKTGKKVFAWLLANGQGEKIKDICDNSAMLQGTEVGKTVIHSLKDATKTYPNAAYLICSISVRQLLEELTQYQIHNIHIVR